MGKRASSGYADAFSAVVQALARRDLTASELEARLARAGFAEHARIDALGRARVAGFVDDSRLASERARRLAGRGASNAVIRMELTRRGVPAANLEAAIDALEDEDVRAERLAGQLGGGLRAARALARMGYPEEIVERTIHLHIAEEP